MFCLDIRQEVFTKKVTKSVEGNMNPKTKEAKQLVLEEVDFIASLVTSDNQNGVFSKGIPHKNVFLPFIIIFLQNNK